MDFTQEVSDFVEGYHPLGKGNMTFFVAPTKADPYMGQILGGVGPGWNGLSILLDFKGLSPTVVALLVVCVDRHTAGTCLYPCREDK